jgi:hypothetical protein
MNKAEAKREARSLVGAMILASPSEFIDGASAEYETEEDRVRVYEALEELANELLARRRA